MSKTYEYPHEPQVGEPVSLVQKVWSEAKTVESKLLCQQGSGSTSRRFGFSVIANLRVYWSAALSVVITDYVVTATPDGATLTHTAAAQAAAELAGSILHNLLEACLTNGLRDAEPGYGGWRAFKLVSEKNEVFRHAIAETSRWFEMVESSVVSTQEELDRRAALDVLAAEGKERAAPA